MLGIWTAARHAKIRVYVGLVLGRFLRLKHETLDVPIDLSPTGPSLITRGCGLDFGIMVPRLGPSSPQHSGEPIQFGPLKWGCSTIISTRRK